MLYHIHIIFFVTIFISSFIYADLVNFSDEEKEDYLRFVKKIMINAAAGWSLEAHIAFTNVLVIRYPDVVHEVETKQLHRSMSAVLRRMREDASHEQITTWAAKLKERFYFVNGAFLTRGENDTLVDCESMFEHMEVSKRLLTTVVQQLEETNLRMNRFECEVFSLKNTIIHMISEHKEQMKLVFDRLLLPTQVLLLFLSMITLS